MTDTFLSRDSKYDGLKCLRDRLTGDELLLWTVETFTMFYEKTWAQTTIIPVIGLMPLIMSIFTFVYDNYSDIDLAIEYYNHAYNNTLPVNENIPLCSTTNSLVNTLQISSETTSNSNCDEKKEFLYSTTEDQKCTDIERTPSEYQAAFITNVVCMASAMLVSYVMCVRELLHHFFTYINKCKWRRQISKKLFIFIKFVIGGICVFPVGPVLAPFFILYIGKL